MNDILYPLYRDELFSKAKLLADYEKLKILYQSVCWMLEHTEENVNVHIQPRNPRQDILQRRNKNNFRVLQQRKIRLEERLAVFEKQIKEEIERSNKEL